MTMTKPYALLLILVGISLFAIAIMLMGGYPQVPADLRLPPVAAALITFFVSVGGGIAFALVWEADLE